MHRLPQQPYSYRWLRQVNQQVRCYYGVLSGINYCVAANDLPQLSQYSRACRLRVAFVAVLLLVWTASSASAQNYSFDARRVALGGVGGTPNLASKLVERQRRYRSILIPVGLVKVLSDVRVFFPNRDDFDFSRAVEFAYSPLHHVFGRREDITVRTFFRDIVRAQLEPDLNAYRGFDD